MAKAMYVVEATHDTGHGLCASVVLVTDQFGAAALLIARRAEQLGYHFYTSLDSYVVINRVSPGVIYGKDGDSTGRNGSPIVYIRRKTSSGWREEWYDEQLQKAHEVADETRK